MKKYIFYIAFFFIFFLGVIVRFFRLGTVPMALTRDEASIGYNAYSLSQTFREEHGEFLPLNIESFGDWKLPVYIYSSIPAIYIFGLNIFSVRLVSAISGVFIILLAAINACLLIDKNDLSRRQEGKAKKLSVILVALFVAFSPWGIHLSHIAYEANLALALFLAGFAFFQLGLKSKKYLIPSLIFCGLSFFTYHSYQVFLPLITIFLLFLYKKELFSFSKKDRPILISLLVLGLVFLYIFLSSSTLLASGTKISGLSIFSKDYYGEILKAKKQYFLNTNNILVKVYANTFVLFIDKLIKNILNLFSIRFLFLEGGGHGSHDIASIGNLYLVELISVLAAFRIFWKKRKRWQKLLIIWVLAASIAPLITLDSAHSIRFSPALFPLSLISAYGAANLITYLWRNKKTYKKIILFFLIISYFYSVYFFAITYFFVSPQRDIDNWNWQMKPIVEYVSNHGKEYDMIVIPNLELSPYIYFLYYWQYEPSLLSGNIDYLPADKEGFRHVSRLENIYFENLDWNENEILRKKILYIIRDEEIPGDKRKSDYYKIEDEITNKYSKWQWTVLSFSDENYAQAQSQK